MFITAVPITKLFARGGGNGGHVLRETTSQGRYELCVFYYCRTYYKAVRVEGGGEWRTCAMRDDEPRPVWMSLPITHWDP